MNFQNAARYFIEPGLIVIFKGDISYFIIMLTQYNAQVPLELE